MNTYKILSKQSVVDGKQKYTEAQIRDMVGAPSREEDELCACGDKVNECSESYEHMTHGV